MAQAKHTPGPWEWDGNVCDYDKENDAPWLVQQPWKSRDRKTVLTGSIKCQSEADARLIAAAPELLEILRVSVIVLEKVEPSGDAASDEVLTMTISTAKAAIAKATGETV